LFPLAHLRKAGASSQPAQSPRVLLVFSLYLTVTLSLPLSLSAAIQIRYNHHSTQN